MMNIFTQQRSLTNNTAGQTVMIYYRGKVILKQKKHKIIRNNTKIRCKSVVKQPEIFIVDGRIFLNAMLIKFLISILRFTIQGQLLKQVTKKNNYYVIKGTYELSDKNWVTETLYRLYLIGIGNLYTCEITMTILNSITIKINHFY